MDNSSIKVNSLCIFNMEELTITDFKPLNKKNNLTAFEKILKDDLLFINILFIFIAIIIQILSILHNKLQWSFPKRTDHKSTKDFFIFSLQIWDLLSDILFSNEIHKKWIKNNNDILLDTNETHLYSRSNILQIVFFCM